MSHSGGFKIALRTVIDIRAGKTSTKKHFFLMQFAKRDTKNALHEFTSLHYVRTQKKTWVYAIFHSEPEAFHSTVRRQVTCV